MKREDFYGEVEEPAVDYDLMEVVFIRVDISSESREAIFDYIKGIFTNDKEKIMKQTGPLPENIIEEVDNMSGVGALILDKGRAEGRVVGRIESLYYDADYTVEEIAKKMKMKEKEIRDILSLIEESEERKR